MIKRRNNRLVALLISTLCVTSCSYQGLLQVYGSLTSGIKSRLAKIHDHLAAEDARDLRINDIFIATQARNPATGLVDPVWQVQGETQLLQEMTYGVVPKGLHQTKEAQPLQKNKIYQLSVEGSRRWGPYSALTCFMINSAGQVQLQDHC